jgi:histidine triad (HIT) family protein
VASTGKTGMKRMLRDPKACIFCQIAGGREPARIVCETDELLCIFPVEPAALGHVLIVTRDHYADVRDCPSGIGSCIFEMTQKMAGHCEEKLGATGFNLLNASGLDAEQSVFHLHFHFLPRFPTTGTACGRVWLRLRSTWMNSSGG